MAKAAVGSGGGNWKKIVGFTIAVTTIIGLIDKENWDLGDLAKFLAAVAFFFG